MNYRLQPTSAIQEALEACAETVISVGYQSWNFYLGAEAFTARVVNDWLLLRGCSVSDQVECERLWQLLQRNAQLPGGVKFALVGCEPLIHARAEIPLVKGMDLTTRVQRACAGFNAGAERMGSKDSTVNEADSSEPSITTDDLARLCHEAGWSASRQLEQALKIDLETPRGFYQAMVQAKSQRICVAVDLAAGAAITPICQEAFAVFLLKAASQLRLARPVITGNADRCVASLQVVFDNTPSSGDLGHAFAALSTGCRIAAAEAAALIEDETLADKCLSVWRVGRRVDDQPLAGNIN